MANVAVYNMEGKEVGSLELNDAIFGVEVNEHLVHMAVLQQLANNRQGTQKAKTRSEVSGGGRKPWRQKGTGHARQGSTRAPQWTHGGVVFAPVPRDYSFKLNKKEKRAALKSALTSRVNESKFVVVDELKLDEIKTKKFVEVMNNLKVEKALVVLNDNDVNVIKSASNLATVKTAQTNEINVYDILKLYGKEQYVSFDLGMLNKHNYYTGIIFKGYTYGTGDAVLKGGRYDNLIEQFGKKAPSVGFAIVLDELMMALSRQGIHMEADHMDTMIIYKEATMKDAILRAEELRKEGKKVILERKNDLCSKADYERFAKEHRLGGILYFI